ncbi:MAG: SRPBCC family protein [Hyphomicrobium sp.]
MADLLIYLLVAAIAAIGTTLFIASRRPDEFYAARSLKIAAPTTRLHGLINDLKKMNTWNPYALRDCGGTAEYSGPEAGPGAKFHFAGKSGTGSITVTDSTASLIGMRLHMTKPFAGDNRVEFTLKPAGDTTEVTWAMKGMASLPGKIFSLFVDCDRMMAKDFDEGLANLKAIAEAA